VNWTAGAWLVHKVRMRTLIALAALFTLAACDASNLEQAQEDMAKLGGQAIDMASSAVDTRTACVLAGQSEAFCGCVQERLGARVTREHVEDITGVVTEAVQSGSIEGAARSAENIDPTTRDALIQCAANTAVQGIIGEGASEN
jgi:hypothetical protein